MESILKILFFGLISLVVYSYAGYPVVLFLLSLFKRRKKIQEPEDFPSVALIISAHNESRIIRDKIQNSLSLDYPQDKLRIIIASDGSNDGMNEIVREYTGGHVVLKAFKTRSGKSATLNRAVLGLDEEILVFSDANAFYRKDAIRRLVKNFSDPEAGCVVGKLVYMDGESNVGKGESLYWKYESLLNRLEGRIKSVLVATGTIFAIRRELYRPVCSDVANDFQIPADISSQGYGILYEREAIASEKASTYFTEEFKRKYRIIVRGLTGFRHLRGDFGGGLRIFQFISRKMMRWCIGPILPVLYFINIFLLDDLFFLFSFTAQTVFYLLAAAWLIMGRESRRSKILYIPFYFVIVNSAAFLAIFNYLSGKRFSAWDKAETTRNLGEIPHESRSFKVLKGKETEADIRSKGAKRKRLEKIT